MKRIGMTAIMAGACFFVWGAANAADSKPARSVASTPKVVIKSKKSGTDLALEGIGRECGHSKFRFKTKSADPRALIEIYARKNGTDVKNPDEFEYKSFVSVKDLPGADEAVDLFGVTDPKGFERLFDNGNDEPKEVAKGRAFTQKLVALDQESKSKGKGSRYIFAFGGGTGGSVCGTTWPGPILIDLQTKTLYEFATICGDC